MGVAPIAAESGVDRDCPPTGTARTANARETEMDPPIDPAPASRPSRSSAPAQTTLQSSQGRDHRRRLGNRNFWMSKTSRPAPRAQRYDGDNDAGNTNVERGAVPISASVWACVRATAAVIDSIQSRPAPCHGGSRGLR